MDVTTDPLKMGMGGVSGGDVRGDGHTDDGGAHPLKSKGDDRKHPPGSAAKKVIFGIAEGPFGLCYTVCFKLAFGSASSIQALQNASKT